jgi:glycosyltransferase involved in cell wall biosynthesis
MISTQPIVSVIVPAFNASQTLSWTLDSVKSQTLREFECLIVDDGSSDDTANIAERYCSDDERFHLIRQSNQGVALARNVALAKTRGLYVAALDADDLWHPDYLKNHVSVLNESSSQVGFSYCLARVINGKGQVIGTVLPYELDGSIADALRYHNAVGNPSLTVFKREIIIAAGGYDERLQKWGSVGSEDWLLLMRVAAVSEARSIPLHLTGYRIMPNSMSSNRVRMARSSQLALQIYASEMSPPPLSRRVDRWQRGVRSFHAARHDFVSGNILRSIAQFCHALVLDPVRIFARLTDILVSFPSHIFQNQVRTFAELQPDESFKSHHQNHPVSHWIMRRRLLGLLRRK